MSLESANFFILTPKAYTSAVTQSPTGCLIPFVADGDDLMGMDRM